ncbi:hypothetical protein [Actimicrobium sp. CCI2.3]|uniref:hypothetical protein n=1 Tax=Actimicrobium sp. CCI2.3 TaxID=3048616 RepID=UPI002AB54E30|nr:hypothetical protein [Actimicrobium sp. CCI2.3]MDY7576484.1 hypothetical protein [Actimicrobium sp. CCI2.3]MEB0021538.1 hypothetical protein [Actimicrobium sp. CCI2.3]
MISPVGSSALSSAPDALSFEDCLYVHSDLAATERGFRQALQLAPDEPSAWSNLGAVLTLLHQDETAERCFRSALARDASYAKARFNLAYLLLRQGRMEEGWLCFEARDWYQRLEQHFTCPRWAGEPLAGKSIVIGFEAGHGDMIQFCRYATQLKAVGAIRITLVCHPGLVRLMASLTAVDEVISFHQQVPASGWDFWTPPMSLPYFFQTRPATIPAAIPYLAADPAEIIRWATRLPASALKVGLAWKGNPRFENDAARSLPSLATLAPLAAVAGVHFISLQKGPGEDEISQTEGFDVLGLGRDFTDFADTAAVIASLDLVISVDTAVAHLAGSLGIPCWVMLPERMTDWRWLEQGAGSPWYPQQMRLFRQAPDGNWEPVIAAIASALRDWCDAHACALASR